MVFSSNAFLFLFLPLFLAVYYLVPNRGRQRNVVVLLGSYAFYAWWRIDFLFLFIAVTVLNYFVGLRIATAGPGTQRASRWLAGGVTMNLLLLGYFKYANFGVASLDAVLGEAGLAPVVLTHVILPIGISFYIFESISYIMDVNRGDAVATRHPVDFATFVALFPHLIAGPVFRYKDLADQFAERRHTVAQFSEGSTRFMQGFVKKVFIADTIAPLANHAFALAHPSGGDAWLGALAYWAQLYFDFSGYSDMAIGLGLMIGFRFLENFNQPFVSQSITEYWRRWHISLSSWLRDYLYVPLGGNRHGVFNTYRNLFLTMLLGGLWHGANWTFVVWGVWHGSLLSIERALGVKAERNGFRPLRWAMTQLFVLIGCVIFRAESVASAWRMLHAMFAFDTADLSAGYVSSINQLQIVTLALSFVVIAVCGWRALNPGLPTTSRNHGKAVAALVLLMPLFVLSLMKLSAQSYSPFLYFQF